MQEEQIYKNYYSLKSIKTKALITTHVYNIIYSFILQKILDEINLYDFQLHEITLEDNDSRILQGIVLIDRQMFHHEFVLAYDAQLYYRRKLFKISSIDEYINYILMLFTDVGAKKENIHMTNKERLKMEIEGITISDGQLEVYLLENNLKANDLYRADVQMNKKGIYQTALSILQSIANQPDLMKNYKLDDQTISNFANSLQSRITQLTKTIQLMPDGEERTSYFNVFM